MRSLFSLHIIILGEVIRSATVNNLLSQNRNITDYYDLKGMKDMLGSGANGQARVLQLFSYDLSMLYELSTNNCIASQLHVLYIFLSARSIGRFIDSMGMRLR